MFSLVVRTLVSSLLIRHSSFVRAAQALALLAACALAQMACSSPGEEPPPPQTLDIFIESVAASSPVLPGTRLVLSTRGVDTAADGSGRTLLMRRAGETSADAWIALAPAPDAAMPGTLAFVASATAIERLGAGTQEVELELVDSEAGRRSAPFAARLTFARELAIRLDQAPGGSVFRNEEVVLAGAGFLEPGEGRVTATFVGEFVPSGGEPRTVLAELPVTLAEAFDRSRGLVTLTTALGGLEPGHFSGTLVLVSQVGTALATRSAELAVELDFEPPALFNYAPADPYLGQIVVVQGGGFLGARPGDPASADEATLLRFEGEIEHEDGTVERFRPREAVVDFRSGREVRFGLEVEPREGQLVSSFFGLARGTFRGTVTPVVLQGTQDLAGEPVAVEFRLRGAQQVVHVRFLPAFYDSLRHFGLAAAADQVIDAALSRMRSIYAAFNVRFELEAPDDMLRSAIAVMEIGGPDPNGLGLFGYDNTPGKDIGNLRLFDSIGGANAQTQADNFPGYGGVFIESFLSWSSHPELAGVTASTPDPLFDEIFDPVRERAVTLEELRTVGSSPRLDQVRRAISALGNIIGETSAHELGHSLGLAQPYGSANAFHSASPGDGCLMDSGGDRPLGERIGEPGYPATRFCGDELQYLQEILPR